MDEKTIDRKDFAKRSEDRKDFVDFDKLTPIQQDTATYILQTLKQFRENNIPLESFSTRIEDEFKLKDEKLINPEDSLLHQYLQDGWKDRLGVTMQGYKRVEENGEVKKVPHMSFSADLDVCDQWISYILEKVLKIQLPK